MTSAEIAKKFVEASNSCEGYKCPFASSCSGHFGECPLRKVAMIIRARDVEIETLKAEAVSRDSMINTLSQHIEDLRKVNRRYSAVISAYENNGGEIPVAQRGMRGYRRKKLKPRRLKPLRDKTLMDGDERYANDVEKKTRRKKEQGHPPLVVI